MEVTLTLKVSVWSEGEDKTEDQDKATVVKALVEALSGFRQVPLGAIEKVSDTQNGWKLDEYLEIFVESVQGAQT